MLSKVMDWFWDYLPIFQYVICLTIAVTYAFLYSPNTANYRPRISLIAGVLAALSGMQGVWLIVRWHIWGEEVRVSPFTTLFYVLVLVQAIASRGNAAVLVTPKPWDGMDRRNPPSSQDGENEHV